MDRDEIDELYGWKEGEREALQADTAERARRNAREESLRWCEARKAARAEAEQQTAEAEQPAQEWTMQQPAAMTDDWVRYIERQLNRRQRIMTGVIADLLAIERKARQQIDGELATLHAETAQLRTELAELRGELKTRSALDEMAERLDRIEQQTARPPLKAIGTALRA